MLHSARVDRAECERERERIGLVDRARRSVAHWSLPVLTVPVPFGQACIADALRCVALHVRRFSILLTIQSLHCTLYSAQALRAVPFAKHAAQRQRSASERRAPRALSLISDTHTSLDVGLAAAEPSSPFARPPAALLLFIRSSCARVSTYSMYTTQVSVAVATRNSAKQSVRLRLREMPEITK